MFNILYVYDNNQDFNNDYGNSWNTTPNPNNYAHEYSFQSYHINKNKKILEIWSGRPNDSWQTFKYSEIKRVNNNNIAINVLE